MGSSRLVTKAHSLLVTDARVWPAPDERLGDTVSILIVDGVIEQIGAGLQAPDDVPRLSAEGRVVTAGFWNCHVHFTGREWSSAATAPAESLQHALDDMLLSHGFTTVLDLSSNPRTTFALMRRIATGELRGPEILTAATGLTPWRGMPFYVKADVPWVLRWLMPAPATSIGARLTVAAQIRGGAKLTKLFTGSYVRPDQVKPMRLPVARAAVAAAHRRGSRVFAHPSNRPGTEVAVEAGVDALAHVPDETEGTETLLRQAAERGIRLVPTLHMFASTVTTDDGYLAPIRAALGGFIRAGGRVLFGTDVGYMADRETRGEYEAMRASGMSTADILRSLTTEPAEFLGRADTGSVAVGNRGDLTVLQTRDDPSPADLANIQATIRAGRAIFLRDSPSKHTADAP
ncbi:hypothetical protein DO944_13420 [Microbacterium sp. SMR1]|nr:hypothetical protein DO944_13420 [Microbacterium sp. SMR1]